MQKRTNPLELKVDAKDYTPAPINPEKKDAPAQTEVAAAQNEQTVIHTAQPAENTATPRLKLLDQKSVLPSSSHKRRISASFC
jgi:hypothetical protein